MNTISLENECTIYEVAGIHNEIIKQWGDSKSPICIDLKAVTEIDVCFLQLLMSCKKTAEKNEVEFQLSHIPDEITNKIKSSFLEQALLNTSVT